MRAVALPNYRTAGAELSTREAAFCWKGARPPQGNLAP